MSKKLIKKFIPKPYDLKHTVENELKNFSNDLSHKPPFALTAHQQSHLNNIQSVGYSIEESFYSKDHCTKLIEKIDQLLVAHKDKVWKDPLNSDFRLFGANRVESLIEEFYSDPFIMEIISNYERTKNLNGFTMAAKLTAVPNNLGSGQGWHRDAAGKRQTKAIVYLTDVNLENGPFQFLVGSHKPQTIIKDQLKYKLDFKQRRFEDEVVQEMVNKNPEIKKTLTAKAGTLILVDTRGIHRGCPIKLGNRYAMTNYIWSKGRIPKHIEKLLIS